MTKHPEPEFASADEVHIPVPGWVIVLTGRIDWLLRWIFDFRSVFHWAAGGSIVIFGLVFTGVVGFLGNSEAVGSVAQALQDYHSGFGDLMNWRSWGPSTKFSFMAQGAILLLPLWIAYRLALLPFWFIGKRLLKRFTSQSQAPT